MANPSIADGAARTTQPMKVVRQIWTDDYIGTAADLVAAGIVKPGQFPGDPGRGKVRVTYYADASKVKVLVVQRVGKERFCAGVYVAADEVQRRLAEWHGERKAAAAQAGPRKPSPAEAEAEAEVQRAAAELADEPATKKEFARRAADAYWAGYHVFYSNYSGTAKGDSGYTFSAADRERFSAMAHRLYWEIRSSKPRLDHAHRMKKLTEARAKAAKVNTPLQRLLAEAIAMPPQADAGWSLKC